MGAGFALLVSFISMPICLTKNRRTQELLERREICDGVSSRLCWIFRSTRADGPDATIGGVDGLRAILSNLRLGPVHGLGPLQEAAGRFTLRDFRGAKSYTIEAQNFGSPDFLCCSALNREGLVEVYGRIFKKRELLHNNGHWVQNRQNQQKQWLRMLVDEELQQRFHHQPGIQEKIEILEEEIISQNKLPSICAENLLDDWFTNNKG